MKINQNISANLIDIELWKSLISYLPTDKYPLLPCPHCGGSALQLDQAEAQKKALPKQYLEQNRKYQMEKKAWDNDNERKSEALKTEDNFFFQIFGYINQFIEEQKHYLNGTPFLYNVFFTCQSCQQHVLASGIELTAASLGDKEAVISYVKFDHFSPPLSMFSPSDNVPQNIAEEVQGAFRYFHFDPPTSAAKLRRAIELFCKDQGAKKGNLYKQIESLETVRPEEFKYLNALRLIGNEGTHGSDVDEVDLLYAFQVVQFVLELYDREARYQALDEMRDKLMDKFGHSKKQEEQHQVLLEPPKA